MLKFQRNKLINVYWGKKQTLSVHGVLEDHIFGLEIDFVIGLDDRTIQAIDGKWNREETPECGRAIPFLQEAIGFKIDDELFGQQVNKIVSRKACPHFANLLIECCDAAGDAIHIIQWEAAQADRPELTFEQYLAQDSPPIKVKEKQSPTPSEIKIETSKPAVDTETGKDHPDGFFIDLHTHSFPASKCSSVSIDDLVQEARRVGLDALCVTDHNFVWDARKIADLTQKYGFPVFHGNEITTDQGDMLVFGMYKDIQGIITVPELRQLVDESGGYMIAAHPFRGFLVFNTSQIGLTVEKATERPLYNLVNALEVLNGKVTAKENAFAGEVAKRLGLPATGGSDAHEIGSVGKYATKFDSPIKNEEELIEALKNGIFTASSFRNWEGSHES